MEDVSKIAESFDAAWFKADDIKQLFDDNIVLHADGLLLNQDISGKDDVVGNFKKYFDLHSDASHSCMSNAVNKEHSTAFGFWQDSSKDGKDSVCGIWKIRVQNGKIKDIYFLRQMFEAEKQTRLKDTSSIVTGGSEYNECIKKGDMSNAKEDFPSTMYDVARRYSDIWQTGDVSIADAICKSDMKSYDLLKGGELNSRDDWKKMVQEVFSFWRPQGREIDIATTPGDNKAFVHWSARGKLEGKEEEVPTFGLNVLEIDPSDGKIMRTAGFRQLEPNEMEKMLKEDAFKKVEA